MKRAFQIMALLVFCWPMPSHAQVSDAPEFNAEIESEAREVGKSLRCVVCQNQSIEDSGAPLAADMRQLVRERLAAGDTPAQVREFMTARYGNFVLMKPPFQVDTLLLWLGPAAFMVLAGLGWFVYLRPRSSILEPPPPLTPDELERVSALAPEATGK